MSSTDGMGKDESVVMTNAQSGEDYDGSGG
jgi:hypothetical protein